MVTASTRYQPSALEAGPRVAHGCVLLPSLTIDLHIERKLTRIIASTIPTTVNERADSLEKTD